MSIIYSNQNGWLVSHLDFILKVYAEGLNKKKDCRGESVELLDSEICEFKKGNEKNSELQVKEAHSQKSEWTEADSPSYEKGLIKGCPASCEEDLEAYTLQGFLEMFNIQAPFLKDEQFVKLKAQAHNPTQLSSFKSKKRRRTPSVIDEESVLVKLLFTRFSEDMKSEKSNSLLVPPQPNSISIPLISTTTLSYCTSHQFNTISSPTTPTIPSVPSPCLSISHATDNNQKARKQCSCVYDLMRKYFEGEDTVSQDRDMDKVPFQGENETEHVVKVEIKNPNSGITDYFILPPRCKFYNWDISYLYGTHQLTDAWTSSRFDFVLLDPPWSNKFVRRKKRQKTNTSNSWYNTMDSVSQLCQIPIAGMLHPSGLVAVWCTNNPSHIAQLTGAVFSAWGLKLVATWYWVKVTKYQDPVLDFSSAPHAKQPYERLLLAVRNSTLDTSSKVGPEDQTTTAECSNSTLDTSSKVGPEDQTTTAECSNSTLDTSSKVGPEDQTTTAECSNSTLDTSSKVGPEDQTTTAECSNSTLDTSSKVGPEDQTTTAECSNSTLDTSSKVGPEDQTTTAECSNSTLDTSSKVGPEDQTTTAECSNSTLDTSSKVGPQDQTTTAECSNSTLDTSSKVGPEDQTTTAECSNSTLDTSSKVGPEDQTTTAECSNSTLDTSSKVGPEDQTTTAECSNSTLDTSSKVGPEDKTTTAECSNSTLDTSPMVGPEDKTTTAECSNSTLDTSSKVGPEDQTTTAECSHRVLPQDKRIVVSVPSSVHSHKPPLSDILAPYLPRTPRCVELFARSLTPGWLSLGNQVLAFQFETLYR